MSAWKEILKTVAPKLGAAIGGPMGGIATKFIANKLLGNENASEEEISLAISGATPSDLARLKEIDHEYDVEVLRIQAGDRADARAIADKRPQMVLSGAYTIGYLGLIFGIMSGHLVVPDNGRDLMMGLLGVLTAAQSNIIQFWFGSSSGSKDKL